MSEITILSKATSKSESLRATVPKSIVNLFKLRPGSKLEWDVTAKNDKLVLLVTPK